MISFSCVAAFDSSVRVYSLPDLNKIAEI